MPTARPYPATYSPASDPNRANREGDEVEARRLRQIARDRVADFANRDAPPAAMAAARARLAETEAGFAFVFAQHYNGAGCGTPAEARRKWARADEAAVVAEAAAHDDPAAAAFLA